MNIVQLERLELHLTAAEIDVRSKDTPSYLRVPPTLFLTLGVSLTTSVARMRLKGRNL